LRTIAKTKPFIKAQKEFDRAPWEPQKSATSFTQERQPPTD
jgi:hypothetical protein